MKKLFYLAIAASLFFASCNDDEGGGGGGPVPTETRTPETTVSEFNNSANYVTFTRTLINGTQITEVDVTDINSSGIASSSSDTVTWTNDRVWVLNGFVFVNDGQVLNIEEGTIIKGAEGQASSASALVVARGGILNAMGTAANPIIFTTEADDIAIDVDGNAIPGGNLPITANGLWGGVIILGDASITAETTQNAIEGIPDTESRGLYGGSDDTDNSGTISFISIRHGGTNIGQDNEINGLTLGGVGSGTSISFVEVISNQDDGIEFFGGTVSVDHALVYNTGDDSFDYDQGWRGTANQYWVSINPGDEHGEHDGASGGAETAMPFATPTISDVTYIGGDDGILFRDNAGGFYSSAIFAFDGGIRIEDRDGTDSRERLEMGDLTISGTQFSGTITFVDTDGNNPETIDSPNVTLDATDRGVTEDNPVGTDTSVGAFSEGNGNWAAGWTLAFP